MLPSIQLNDDAKLQVLLVALALFLSAVLISLCLALSCCPLNKWLLKRAAKRRARRQQQQEQQWPWQWTRPGHNLQHNLGHFCARTHQQPGWPKLAAAGGSQHGAYIGPPPAYEAALRATRLQSLTGSCLVPGDIKSGAQQQAAGPQTVASPDWLKTALHASQNNTSDHFNYEDERQLDLGDYFHQPRDFGETQGSSGGAAGARPPPRPPVMMRLWVRLMEPGELVQRARAQTQANKLRQAERAHEAVAGEVDGRRLSLTRQLSIPHLFGSLMTSLSSGKSNSALEIGPAAVASEETGAAESKTAQGADQQPSSLSSETNSSMGEDERQGAELKGVTSSGDEATRRKEGAPREAGSRNRDQSLDAASTARALKAVRRRHSIPPIASSITSRVLHMNVASFSYVKDEELISTKKHNQLNFHHFYAPLRASTPTPAAPATISPPAITNKSKLCQLLVSICDIENLLNASRWESRAHFRLAQHSSIYVKCEILAPKSRVNLGQAASRLLRNPLKVLTHQQSNGSSSAVNTLNFASVGGGGQQQHATVDFGATIAAASMEPPPAASKQQASGASGQTSADASPSDWRHDPNADGKSIVAFNSIPKQIAQQQHLAAASGPSSRSSWSSQQLQQDNDSLASTPVDLIQFDSVFVGPILSKALLEECCLRLRVYSQCKYVNESCLAELKLPLKQLVRTQTRDNLGTTRAAHAMQQADLILDNLLANLVTASTGSPLGTLMEQISAEAREEALEATRPDAEGPAGFLSGWLAGGAGNLQRASSSLGSALNRLETRPPVTPQQEHEDDGEATSAAEWQDECARQLEQNYCRSLLVSHWLNYLVAPAYECQPVEEARGKLLLGLTYLPTSNRLVFNAHRAALEQQAPGAATTDKQLIKGLRLQSDTSYLLRFLMVANGRVLKRKQTSGARKPEWDSQEPVTFDLVSVSVERPTFVVCLVMRNSRAHATGSLQSLTHDLYQQAQTLGVQNQRKTATAAAQSDPESLRYATGPAHRAPGQLARALPAGAKRDLVIGHLVLGEQVWQELRSQPRRQIIKQFKLL